MASVKVKFRPSTVVGHEGIIYYQIIHERKVRQLRTEYKILASEWNENRSTVTTTLHSERKGYILSIREKIRLDIAERQAPHIRDLQVHSQQLQALP